MRRALAALLSVVAALMVVPPAFAGIGDSIGRSIVKQRANAIMNLTYSQFDSYRRDVHDAPFNWTTDGCSYTPPAWADLFRRPCNLHDFGYWNYGHTDGQPGLELGVNKNTRAWIDHRLLEEMVRLCDHKYHAWWRSLNKVECLDQATIIYGAVRNFGGSSYYH
jgi:hypothetical protein